MGKHINPGFVFKSNGEGDEVYLTVENLNKLVGEASINPDFIYDLPQKKELKNFDKLLTLDAYSRSFEQIEVLDLFKNVNLSGKSTSSTPSLTDSSDRIVTTKFLNLLLGDYSKNKFINLGLFILKSYGRGNGGKKYSISNFNSHNHDKYLVFVDGLISEYGLEYNIDEEGTLIFSKNLSKENSYLILTLNNSKTGANHFNRNIFKTTEQKVCLEGVCGDSDNPENYLVFVDKKLQKPGEDFLIRAGTITFKSFIQANSTVIIYNLPNNSNNSYFNYSNLISDEGVLAYDLPVAIGSREEDYLIFLNERIMIPGVDYQLFEDTQIKFAKPLPSNIFISIFALINNNNSFVFNKDSKIFNSFNFQVELLGPDKKLKIKNFTNRDLENYLIFAEDRLIDTNSDVFIEDDNLIFKNEEFLNKKIKIVSLKNKEYVSIPQNFQIHFSDIKYEKISNNIIKLSEEAQKNNLIIFENGIFKDTNTYEFISENKIQFFSELSDNLIFLKLNSPNELLYDHVPTIPIDKLSGNNSKHGDVLFYSKEHNQWISKNIFKIKDLKISDFNLPLSNLFSENAEHGDTITYDGILKQWKVCKTSSNIVNQSSQIFNKIKLADLDVSECKKGFLNYNGKILESVQPSIQCSSAKKNEVYDVNYIIFDDNFKLNYLNNRLFVEFKKKTDIKSLYSDSALENDVLVFKDGSYKSLPIKYVSPLIIPINENINLEEKHINNIIISNSSENLIINIPSYNKLEANIGSKITVIQAQEGSIRFTSEEDTEIICKEDFFITNKKGCKVELLKLTHRKWGIFF